MLPILVGLVSGLIGGFSGLAGSVLVITFLSMFRMVPDQETAAGTTLLIFVPPLSILALYHYWKRGKIKFGIVWWIMAFYVVGAGLGALGTSAFTDKQLKLFLSVILVILSIFSFIIYRREK